MVSSSVRTLCCFLALAPLAWGQVAIPNTPAGKNLAALLTALNSGDRDVIAEYASKYGPKSNGGTSPDNTVRMAQRIGRLDLGHIVESSRLELQFVAKTAAGLQLLGMLAVEDADPPRVAFSLPWVPVPRGSKIIGYDIDAPTRLHVIDEIARKLNDSYVVADTAERMSQALERNEKDGNYDDVTNGWLFANRLTKDLRAISHDKHLVIGFGPIAGGQPVRGPYSLEPDMAASQYSANCGFERSEVLPGGIGYVKIDRFVDPNMCRSKAVEVLMSLDGAKTLIFDLRDAIGGNTGMVTLILRQLFDGPPKVSSLHSRLGVRELRLGERVPGLTFDRTPVYILTSSRTFSGAEWFAYDLQALNRATIVGEKTGGGAHSARPEPIDERFQIYLPWAQAVNPITGTNWEGTGVKPDIPVPAADALGEATKLAQRDFRNRIPASRQIPF